MSKLWDLGGRTKRNKETSLSLSLSGQFIRPVIRQVYQDSLSDQFGVTVAVTLGGGTVVVTRVGAIVGTSLGNTSV